MPIDEQVSMLDKLMEKIVQDDRARRVNQRIIPKYIDEAIENLLRSRIVRSRFRALLLLAGTAAKDINQAVNDRVTSLVKVKVTKTEAPTTTPVPRKRASNKTTRNS